MYLYLSSDILAWDYFTMRLLKEFVHTRANLNGRRLTRTAVRAIIRRGDFLLMIFSPVNGDYKFPGGGVEAGETHHQALAREIREECGARLLSVDGEFGQTVEYHTPVETEIDVFVMTSDYYLCSVQAEGTPLQLDAYEVELGFHPAWVSLEEAIRTNRAVISSLAETAPRWTERETYLLELLLPGNATRPAG